MANTTAHSQKTTLLTRYKVFEQKHHLNHRVYRNRGVLKDAERFSLVDTVLDGEYNDIEIIDYRKSLKKNAFQKAGKNVSRNLAILKSGMAGVIFKFTLVIRLAFYFVFHMGYKAE